MRRLLAFLLLLASSASADVVAGRRLILVHDVWVPPTGGAVTPLGVAAKTAAFDGERFLTGWREGEQVWLALYEEGATVPSSRTSLDIAGSSSPIVRWNGSVFVVFCDAHLVLVSRQGLVESVRRIPQAQSIADMAASPFGIALVASYGTETHVNVIDVLLLDNTPRVATRTTVASLAKSFSHGAGGRYLDQPRIAPFGSMFYAVWRDGRHGFYHHVAGARVMLDGSAPGAGTLLSDADPYPITVALHPYGSRMAVQPVRLWGAGITTTFVDSDGRVTQTNYRMATGHLGFPPRIDTVRLADGSIVAVYVRNGVAFVTKMISAPPSRRRAV